MIIVLKPNPDKKQLDNLVEWLEGMDLKIHWSTGTTTTIMGLIGDTSDATVYNSMSIGMSFLTDCLFKMRLL